jgi:cobalt/nickel transport system permease protein
LGKKLRDKVLFGLYVVGLGSILSTHSLYALLFFTVVLGILARKSCFSLLKKTLKSVIFFNIAVSIGYIIAAHVAGRPWVNYLLLFNLRVFDLTFLTFLLAASINIAQALSFSKTLSFLWTISLSQIYSYQKSFENFMLSLKSRLIKKMNERAKKEFIASVFGYFFTKALYDSEEKSLALKARGLFDHH